MTQYRISTVRRGDWHGDDAKHELRCILFAGYRVMTEDGWAPLGGAFEDDPDWFHVCGEGTDEDFAIEEQISRLVREVRTGELSNLDPLPYLGVDLIAFDVPTWWDLLDDDQKTAIVEKWLSEDDGKAKSVHWEMEESYSAEEWDDDGNYIA